jgi:hypothetical protein
MSVRIVACTIAIVACSLPAAAQEPRAYLGGTFDLATQTESDTVPLGGTTVGGRALIGVQVSPRVSIEFEPSFAGSYSWEYSYRPTPSTTADVVASRSHAFFTGQARIKFGVFEPVVGLSYVRGQMSRHATIGSTTYFDDSGSSNGLAVVGGLDAPIPLRARLFLVPTIRLFVTLPNGTPASPLESQTATGALLIRYGAGVRVEFE